MACALSAHRCCFSSNCVNHSLLPTFPTPFNRNAIGAQLKLFWEAHPARPALDTTVLLSDFLKPPVGPCSANPAVTLLKYSLNSALTSNREAVSSASGRQSDSRRIPLPNHSLPP